MGSATYPDLISANSGVPRSSASSVYYSAASGSDLNDGLSAATPIKTITELGRRFWGFGLSGSANLFTDAALTDSEAALYYQFTANDGRQWNLINGALPFTPKFLYLASNIDGQNNTTLTDGQTLTTWKNLGSLGSAADLTAHGSPTFKKIASAGKLNNGSSVVFPGTAYFTSSAQAGLVAPATYVMVNKIHAPGTLQVLATGLANVSRCTLYTSTSWGLDSGAGTAVPPPNPVADQYNLVYVSFQTGNATFAANFSEVDSPPNSPLNAGNLMITGVTLGANYDGTLILTGEVAAFAVADNTPPTPDVHGWDPWAQYKFGLGFPQ